jgi:hypothetical protein
VNCAACGRLVVPVEKIQLTGFYSTTGPHPFGRIRQHASHLHSRPFARGYPSPPVVRLMV